MPAIAPSWLHPSQLTPGCGEPAQNMHWKLQLQFSDMGMVVAVVIGQKEGVMQKASLYYTVVPLTIYLALEENL